MLTEVVTIRCQRCERLVLSFQLVTECDRCVQAAQAVWPGIGPIAGEMSGT